MNTQKAKTIPIEQVLSKMGIFPQKVSGSDLWFLSPFTTEKTPSFKINIKMNRWYCHSSGCGGNTLDFVIKKTECSISEALNYLKDFNFSFSFHKQISEVDEIKNENSPTIIKTIPIQHSALIQYLNQRGITKFRSVKQLKEIHYSIQDKKYFALGFENNSSGIEVRNKYAKLCLLKKDITLISNNSNNLKVFEGYFDYLSFLNIENLSVEKTDYLILNSVALINKNISLFANYNTIELYLDNDEAGDKYTSLILNQFPVAQDCRIMYNGFKDVNEFHMYGCLNEGSI